MPTLARVYGIPPKDQPELKLRQFRRLQQDYVQNVQPRELAAEEV